MEQFKTQNQKHYANDAEELNHHDLFKKSKERVTKHDDQSKEHHREEANLDQSCRSARFIVEKCPMRHESIGRHSRCGYPFKEFKTARTNVKRSGEWFGDLVKLTLGGLIPAVLDVWTRPR